MSNYQLLYRNRLQFTILQTIFLGLILLLIKLDFISTHNLSCIYILCYWNILIYAWLTYYEIKYSAHFHPFMILGVIIIQYLGMNGISLISELKDGIPIMFGIYNVSNYVLIGTLYLSIEHFLLFSGYYLWDYLRHKNNQVYAFSPDKNFNYLNTALLVYIALWIVRIIGIFINLYAVTSLLVLFARSGQIITLILLVFYILKTPQNGIVKKLFWIITLAEIIIAMGSGMKENILQNILPYGIYLIVRLKNGTINWNTSFYIKIGVLGAFVIFGVFPYIAIFREIAQRTNREWKDVGISEVIEEYSDYMTNSGYYSSKWRYQNLDSEYFMNRVGSIANNTWAIYYTDTFGTQPQYALFAASGLIPRVLWPGKPKIATGRMIYCLAKGYKNWDQSYNTTGTSFSIGFIGGCYFALSYWGLIIPFLIGCFICWLWYYSAPKMHNNIIAIWIFYTIIASICKDFENITDCGMTFITYSIAYCIIMNLIPSPKHSRRKIYKL